MKTTTTAVCLSLALCFASAAYADTFGNGLHTFDIEFVHIGDPGNPVDNGVHPNPNDNSHPKPTGSVADPYRIGKFEISEEMIEKANLEGGLGITKDSRGPNQPATRITWYEAATFVNWLNTSTGSTPAWKDVKTQVPFSLQVEAAEAAFDSWRDAVLLVRFKNHTSENISIPLGVSGGPGLDNYNLRFSAKKDGLWYQAAFKMHSLHFSRPIDVSLPPNGISAKLRIPLSLLVWQYDPKFKYETPKGIPYPTGNQGHDHAVSERIVPLPGLYSCKLGYTSDPFAASQEEAVVWSNVVQVEIKPKTGEQAAAAGGDDTAVEP